MFSETIINDPAFVDIQIVIGQYPVEGVAHTFSDLIRDPGTRDRTTFNMVKEYFPQIRVIRTYDVTEALRETAAAAMAAE